MVCFSSIGGVALYLMVLCCVMCLHISYVCKVTNTTRKCSLLTSLLSCCGYFSLAEKMFPLSIVLAL